MSATSSGSTITELIDTFIDSPPDRVDAHYQQLVDAVWRNRALTDESLSAAPELVAALDRADQRHQGYLAILLGLLAEAGADGPVAEATRQGLDRYLELWAGTTKEQPLYYALHYLVSHFPADRHRILAAAADRDLDVDDQARLDRALLQLGDGDLVLGRVFPSPAAWTMNEREMGYDLEWIKALTPEQVAGAWFRDTRTVRGSAGAKAYWAVCNGTPTPGVNTVLPPRDPDLTRLPDADFEVFARHGDKFRCPACRGGLDFGDGDSVTARCADCSTEYSTSGGILDLTRSVSKSADELLYKLAEMPSMGLFYEALARPHFLRVSGQNWGSQVTLADEDAYLASHVQPVDGPVLDLAAGAGRWTAVIADVVGPERLIALDMNPPMLTVLRHVLPKVPAVKASAAELPFDDASLGAVVCWNALQAFPDDAPTAIAEVGRCLRPGGTFTALTFRRSGDPVYDHFVRCHYLPQADDGLLLFDIDELRGWLAAANLTIRDESGPGTFVFITAERQS